MRSVRLWLLAAVSAAFGFHGPAIAAEQALVAYNTYLQPPFLEADGGGLAQDLVEALNQQLGGRLRLRLEHVPRERLVRQHLQGPEPFRDLALFLSPAFVDDAEQTRWRWTQPLFDDVNVLVFPANPFPPPKQLAELKGRRFGAILGNRYPGLDAMAEAGEITRENSNSDLALLRKLALGRVDFAQMNRLMFLALSAQAEFEGRFQAIPQPQQKPFARRILMGREDTLAFSLVEAAVERLRCQPSWRARLQELDIELPRCAAR